MSLLPHPASLCNASLSFIPIHPFFRTIDDDFCIHNASAALKCPIDGHWDSKEARKPYISLPVSLHVHLISTVNSFFCRAVFKANEQIAVGRVTSPPRSLTCLLFYSVYIFPSPLTRHSLVSHLHPTVAISTLTSLHLVKDHLSTDPSTSYLFTHFFQATYFLQTSQPNFEDL
jgi:hypothetical protein